MLMGLNYECCYLPKLEKCLGACLMNELWTNVLLPPTYLVIARKKHISLSHNSRPKSIDFLVAL
jgi:hypothetical protein